jgi:hypothetical protein
LSDVYVEVVLHVDAFTYFHNKLPNILKLWRKKELFAFPDFFLTKESESTSKINLDKYKTERK